MKAAIVETSVKYVQKGVLKHPRTLNSRRELQVRHVNKKAYERHIKQHETKNKCCRKKQHELNGSCHSGNKGVVPPVSSAGGIQLAERDQYADIL
jgi:hypothetical protein